MHPNVSVELNKQTEKYLKLRLDQVTTSYDDEGKETKEHTYMKLEKCDINDADTETEEQFFKYNESSFFYCVKNPEAYLLGTRDNLL